MQNRSNFPQNKSLSQSPVRTSPTDKPPVSSSTHLGDGKTPNQPTESREA